MVFCIVWLDLGREPGHLEIADLVRHWLTALLISSRCLEPFKPQGKTIPVGIISSTGRQLSHTTTSPSHSSASLGLPGRGGDLSRPRWATPPLCTGPPHGLESPMLEKATKPMLWVLSVPGALSATVECPLMMQWTAPIHRHRIVPKCGANLRATNVAFWLFPDMLRDVPERPLLTAKRTESSANRTLPIEPSQRLTGAEGQFSSPGLQK